MGRCRPKQIAANEAIGRVVRRSIFLREDAAELDRWWPSV
jgi:hypothetical protein